MKRKYPILIVIIIIGLLNACSSSKYEITDVIDIENYNFIETIKEINGHSAHVSAKIYEGNLEGMCLLTLLLITLKHSRSGTK